MAINYYYILYAAIAYVVIGRIRYHLRERQFQQWAKEQGAAPAQTRYYLKVSLATAKDVFDGGP